MAEFGLATDSAVHTLPTGSQERKDVPLVRGCLDYFPAALAYVARVSKAGNDKHNPGEEMHHARGKSMDHADCIARHLVDRGTVDPEDGLRHAGKVAWRALALLQEELEDAGEAPLARGAKLPDVAVDFTPCKVKSPGCYGCECKPKLVFGVERDPSGTRYRRTGERRKPNAGDWFIAEGPTSRGMVLQDGNGAGWREDSTRIIVELV